MTSGFIPLAGGGLAQPPLPRAGARRASQRAVAVRGAGATPLTWCVLALTLLVELAVAVFPQALLLVALQRSAVFRTATGYPMLALLAFSLAFGWLRRRGVMVSRQRKLNELHQLGGLLLLVLLALHAAGRPAGFLLYTLHGMSVALAAGALRSVLGLRLGRGASLALLVLHVTLACVIAAAALLHLYFVLAYTA